MQSDQKSRVKKVMMASVAAALLGVVTYAGSNLSKADLKFLEAEDNSEHFGEWLNFVS